MRAKFGIAAWGTLWVWIALCLVAPLVFPESLFHAIFTYCPPSVLCFPAVIALVGLLVKALRRKGTRTDLLVGLMLLGSIWLISGFEIPQPSSPGNGPLIKIMTINVELRNRDVPGLEDYLRRRGIDIVLMQEVKGEDQSPAQKMIRAFPGWHLATVGELAILSRWPLADIKSDPLRSQKGRFVLQAKVDGPEPFRIATTHWTVPQITKGFDKLERTLVAQRHDYEDTLSALVSSDAPIILGGDFNNPPRNVLSRSLSDRMTDAFSERGVGFGWTYPASRPVARIDHFFSSKEVGIKSAEVGPSFGSDHRSLYAEFRLPSRLGD